MLKVRTIAAATGAAGRRRPGCLSSVLYLINPSGVVFGPHATVNVSGSFYDSTAD
jgi:filamentous hemagglutinin family protein